MPEDHYNRLNVAIELGHALSRIEELEAALNADAETLRLAFGELTPAEVRLIKAAFGWVLSQPMEVE